MGIVNRVEQDLERDELQRRERARQAREAAEARLRGDEDLRRRDTPGDLVFKTTVQQERKTAVVPPKTAPGEQTIWWQWVDKRIEYNNETLREAIGQIVSMERRDARDALMREVDLIRRELGVLQAEVGIRALQKEVATARADVSKLPDIEARFEAKQAEMTREITRLRRELATTKDKLANARVDIGQVEYGLKQLERKPPTVEVKMQTKDSQFTLKDDDPETMALWREFTASAFAENAKGAAMSVAGHILLPPGHRNGAASQD